MTWGRPSEVGPGYLGAGAMLIALHLACVTVLEPAMTIWPPKTGEVLWRVVFLTQALNLSGTPLLAAGLVAATGVLRRRAGLAYLAAGFAGLLSLALIGMVALLALDFVQLRGTVTPEHLGDWDRSVMLPGMLGSAAAAVALLLAIGAASSARQLRRRQEEAVRERLAR